MKRDDIEGNDEDLSAVEELVLREIEQTANADMLQRVKKQECEIISQINYMRERISHQSNN